MRSVKSSTAGGCRMVVKAARRQWALNRRAAALAWLLDFYPPVEVLHERP